MLTDEGAVFGLVNSVSDPIFVVIPKQQMEPDELARLFQSMEIVLEKIEEKVGHGFDILVESATYFGGYEDMHESSEEQKAEFEEESQTEEGDGGTHE